MLEERRNGVGRETELQWKGVGQWGYQAMKVLALYLPGIRIRGRAAVVGLSENVDFPPKMSKMHTECKGIYTVSYTEYCIYSIENLYCGYRYIIPTYIFRKEGI